MHIAMIGTGYVGLVSGVCIADFGHHVIGVDKDSAKIEAPERGADFQTGITGSSAIERAFAES